MPAVRIGAVLCASWNFTEAIFGSAELLERVVMVKLSSSEDSEEDMVVLLS